MKELRLIKKLGAGGMSLFISCDALPGLAFCEDSNEPIFTDAFELYYANTKKRMFLLPQQMQCNTSSVRVRMQDPLLGLEVTMEVELRENGVYVYSLRLKNCQSHKILVGVSRMFGLKICHSYISDFNPYQRIFGRFSPKFSCVSVRQGMLSFAADSDMFNSFAENSVLYPATTVEYTKDGGALVLDGGREICLGKIYFGVFFGASEFLFSLRNVTEKADDPMRPSATPFAYTLQNGAEIGAGISALSAIGKCADPLQMLMPDGSFSLVDGKMNSEKILECLLDTDVPSIENRITNLCEKNGTAGVAIFVPTERFMAISKMVGGPTFDMLFRVREILGAVADRLSQKGIAMKYYVSDADLHDKNALLVLEGGVYKKCESDYDVFSSILYGYFVAGSLWSSEFAFWNGIPKKLGVGAHSATALGSVSFVVYAPPKNEEDKLRVLEFGRLSMLCRELGSAKACVESSAVFSDNAGCTLCVGDKIGGLHILAFFKNSSGNESVSFHDTDPDALYELCHLCNGYRIELGARQLQKGVVFYCDSGINLISIKKIT